MLPQASLRIQRYQQYLNTVAELDPVDEIEGRSLDQEAMTTIDGILEKCITDPVGPEFMAPPAR